MTKVNKIDRLFALKGVAKKIDKVVKELDSECASELLRDYEENGTTQRRSQYFGKDAGTYSLVLPKEETRHDFELVDSEAFWHWVIENEQDVSAYICEHTREFAAWLIETTGEVPDGIEHSTYTVMTTSKPRLSVKEDVVIDKLGANFLEATNQLLLEGE